MAENYGSLTGTLDAHDTLEGNLDNHGEMSGEVQFGGVGSKVDDVLVNGESVVENKIAHIDLTPYAEIENVYDKTTIDTALQGKADVEDIPTDLSELQDDADHRTVTDAEKTEWSGKADTSDIPTALSQLDNDDNYVQDEHYQHTDNNYTSNEKNKLADIESGAEANVQSDWNESDTSSDAYILNKPTIPSVVANPQNTTATLTSIGIDGTNYAVQGGGGGGAVNDVKVNDTSVVDSQGVANIDLTGYATTSDIPTDLADLQDDSTHRLVTDTEKTTWDNKSDFSGSYNDLTDKPTIPSALADLTDDSTHRVVTDTEKTTWNGKSDFSGSYNDLTDKPTIPDAQIQSDWNQSDNTKVDFIKNKPTFGTAAAKDSTNAVTQNSTDLVESGAVWSAIDNLPEPMVFKGTLGVNGTIASLPTASSSNNGYTYKVITAGTYDGKSAKVGDVFTSNATEWVLIPSGDETFTDTWRSVKVDGTELLGSSITTGAVNFKSGTNVTVSGSGNDITISATDTTYSKATAQADGLMSKEDFSKLSGIETGAQVNVQSDWNQANTSADDYIKNKPTLGTASALNVASSGDASTTEVVKGDDSRLSDARTPVSHTHTTSDITDFPTMSDYIQKSSTSGLVKNDGTIDTNSYATTSQIPDISGKADKVSGATNGNLAGLNASGNLTDSTWSADKTTQSATGNPISISGLKSNQLAINPIITLEPIETGTGTKSPANPWTISGYDKVEVESCGKNLFDGTWYQWTPENGTTLIYNANAKMSVTRIKANSVFTVYKNGGNRFFILEANEYPVTGHSYTLLYNGGATQTGSEIIQTSANAMYLLIYVDNNNATGIQLQVEEGNVASPVYVPYVKTTSISESLGQTVYGGTLDLRSGKLIDNMNIVNDLSEGTWTLYAANSFFSDSFTTLFLKTYSGICSAYKNCGASVTVIENYGFVGDANGRIYMKNEDYSDATAFTNSLANVQFCAPKKTSTTIQLTPHEISLLKDYAYVSTNGTNIAFDYHNGELASLGDVAQVGETVNELGDNLNTKINTNIAFAVSGILSQVAKKTTGTLPASGSITMGVGAGKTVSLGFARVYLFINSTNASRCIYWITTQNTTVGSITPMFNPANITVTLSDGIVTVANATNYNLTYALYEFSI